MKKIDSEFYWKEKRAKELKYAIDFYENGPIHHIDVWKNELISLENWLKNNTVVIFTTTDGKKLTDRSTEVWVVDKKTLERETGNGNSIGTWLNGWYADQSITNILDENKFYFEVLKYIKERYEVFSSVEKAREYVIDNKPCISISQIENAISKNMGTTYTRHKDVVNELRNLVKTIHDKKDI